MTSEPIDSSAEKTTEEIRAWLKAIQTTAGEGFERPAQGLDQERDWGKFD